MRNPRTNTLLLTAILVMVGLVGQAWLARVPESEVSATVPVKSIAAAKPVAWQSGSASPIRALVSPVRPVELAAAPEMSLSADASGLVGTMCDLQLLAEGTGLTLDSDQWSGLATVVVRAQAIRHNYEAQIATAQLIAPGQYRVQIPAYADAGDALRAQFTTDLRTELGEPVAREVMTRLGDKLEGRFAGFGVSVQTLDITADPAGSADDIAVMRTASYWNSVEGGERVTTRREVSFPAHEDPTGDSWHALLAMVGVATVES